MRKPPAIDETVAPNLVPMIDIMFLLLLFFMLSADMSQREIEDVALPPAESAKDDRGNDARVTVNIYHAYDVRCAEAAAGHVCREERHWRLGIRGRDFADPAVLREWLQLETRPAECEVHIRADLSAPYGLAQRVMHACVKVGISRIEVGVAKKT